MLLLVVTEFFYVNFLHSRINYLNVHLHEVIFLAFGL